MKTHTHKTGSGNAPAGNFRQKAKSLLEAGIAAAGGKFDGMVMESIDGWWFAVDRDTLVAGWATLFIDPENGAEEWGVKCSKLMARDIISLLQFEMRRRRSEGSDLDGDVYRMIDRIGGAL